MKKVFVILVNYNKEKITIECLDSLKKIKNINVVVVDNYPSSPIRNVEKDYKIIGLKIIYNEKNLGFTGGNNTGIDYALTNGADYVLILNNDTLVDSSFADELVYFANSHQDAGIVAPKIYFAKGYEFHKDRYRTEDLGKIIWYAGGLIDWKNVYASHRGVDEVDKGQYDDVIETEFATGCCFLMPREVIEKVGKFDDDYFLYFEDADLSQRVKKKGYKVYYNPQSVIWHKNASSTGGSGSDLQDYYLTRNRLLFGFKYAPARAKFALFREGLRNLSSGRKWQKRGVLDFLTRTLGKGSFSV